MSLYLDHLATLQRQAESALQRTGFDSLLIASGIDAAVVDRVVRLVRISEWKRQQAAPGPKVSRRAFGRERRYPITSGWRE